CPAPAPRQVSKRARACPRTTFFEDFVAHFVPYLIEIRPFRQSARQSGRLSVPKNVLLGQWRFSVDNLWKCTHEDYPILLSKATAFCHATSSPYSPPRLNRCWPFILPAT